MSRYLSAPRSVLCLALAAVGVVAAVVAELLMAAWYAVESRR